MNQSSFLSDIVLIQSFPFLLFLQVNLLEAPFIWTYRRDYLHSLMTRKHLWTLLAWDEKWDKLYSIKKRYVDVLLMVCLLMGI